MSIWSEHNLAMPNGDKFGEEVGVKLVNCPHIPKAAKQEGKPLLIANSEKRIAFMIDPNSKIILKKYDLSEATFEKFEAFCTAMTTTKPSAPTQPKKTPNPSPRRTTL